MTKEKQIRNNIFGTILTEVAPASNYRGDSEGGNFTPLQKLRFRDGALHTVFSAESIRSKLREMLCGEDFPCNRSRLKNEGQLAVMFKEYPNPLEFADDKLFGFLALKKGEDRKKVASALEKAQKEKGDKRDPKKIEELEKKLALFDKYEGFQGDSVLRINYAVSLNTFDDFDSTMHQCLK